MKRTHFTDRGGLKIVDGLEPDPISSLTIPDSELVAEVRRLDCRKYDGCLNFAVDQNWAGFACTECLAYERLSEREMLAQGRRIAVTIRERGAGVK